MSRARLSITSTAPDAPDAIGENVGGGVVASSRRPRREHKQAQTAAFSARSGFHYLNALNYKTAKGEHTGYLSAIMYLAPHTIGGGPSLCPHSTEACRTACLYSAGRGAFDRTKNARLRRTHMYLNDRPRFLREVVEEVRKMQKVAERHGLKLAVRLNGTSDILWERQRLGAYANFMEAFPDVAWYDYSKVPLEHRDPPANYHILFSLADDNLSKAVEYLKAGHSISAVVPDDQKANMIGSAVSLDGDGMVARFVDGDEDDTRFLDKPRSIVLLSPKGTAARNSPLVRQDLWGDLRGALQ